MTAPALATNAYKKQIAEISGIYNVLHYGATGLGVDDDLAGIQATVDAAELTGGIVYFPPGTYNYSATITINSATDLPITLDGSGANLVATVDTLQDINVLSDNVTIKNITMTSSSSVRGTSLHNHRIVLNGADGTAGNCTVENVEIDGSKASGIFNRVTNSAHIIGCHIHDTLADGIHNFGATNVRISDCLAERSGDDGVAFISSLISQRSSGQVNNCRALTSSTRGFSAVGANGVTFNGCYSEDSGAAGFYAAYEETFGGTSGVIFNACVSKNAMLTAQSAVHGAFNISSSNVAAFTGAHDGAGNVAILTDSGESWGTNYLVGYLLKNTTDGSEGFITANTGTTVTAVLRGGTDDDWDASDAYSIIPMVSNVQFNACRSENPYYGHISISGGATDKTVRNIVVANCIFEYQSNAGKNGIFATNTRDSINITGNTVLEARRAGIYIETTCIGNIQINNNTLINPNQDNVAGVDGIYAALAGNLILSNNVIDVTYSPANLDRSIQADGAATVGLISGNHTDFGAAALIKPPSAVMELPRHGASDLADISHLVNTSALKHSGTMVFDLTNNKIKIATGNNDNSTWVDADGTTAVTPV